jgi:hypothetical protein
MFKHMVFSFFALCRRDPMFYRESHAHSVLLVAGMVSCCCFVLVQIVEGYLSSNMKMGDEMRGRK